MMQQAYLDYETLGYPYVLHRNKVVRGNKEVPVQEVFRSDSWVECIAWIVNNLATNKRCMPHVTMIRDATSKRMVVVYLEPRWTYI